ncbi:hypothetical protein [Marinilabilia sp.]
MIWRAYSTMFEECFGTGLAVMYIKVVAISGRQISKPADPVLELNENFREN